MVTDVMQTLSVGGIVFRKKACAPVYLLRTYSCLFIETGSSFLYAVMMLSQLNSIIVWGFELKC